MTAPKGLHTLARLYGIQTAYHDNDGSRIGASPQALLAALRALGVEVDDAAAVRTRAEHRRRVLWERAVGPVVVVWTPADGGLDGTASGSFGLRTPAGLREGPVRTTVGIETGGQEEASHDGSALEVVRAAEVGGREYVERTVPLPAVAPGYHDLVVEVGTGRERRRYEALLIAAPKRAVDWHALPGRSGGRPWGVFAPLYALHARNGGRGGDRPPSPRPGYPLLARFADLAADAGASVVGTLPLMAAFLDEPYEPSPYAPVSRLFWNELYVTPDGERGAAGAAVEPADRYVDPRSLMAERRPALEAEARAFFEGDAPPEFHAFLARNPLAEEYARFRALTEARGPWDRWPDRLRARDVRPGDYDPEVARYHLYVQQRAERQLAEVAERGASRGVSLYLDLPMGVHSQGYDVWRERSLFATGASAGAPPDALAPGGQDWGFPPLHPEASRLQGHRYFIASIRKHLRFAGVLRIDHIMQLNRMFWVPAGDARDGVYVRYPAEELYAIICLESHRAQAVVVGEDLGTVPREVRRAMRRHGLPGMYVLQFQLTEAEDGGADADPASVTDTIPDAATDADTDTATDTATDVDMEIDVGTERLVPRRVPEGALASIGTHDTPMFAGWWWGEDVRIRRELGQIPDEEAERELEGRRLMREQVVRGMGAATGRHTQPGTGPHTHTHGGEEEALEVQEAMLRFMGRSNAGLVLATLEDLWLEREPQNVPGTTSDRNWRRRAERPLEAMSDDERIAGLLRALNESREGKT